MTKIELVEVLSIANEAPFEPKSACGCGRAYVMISDKKLARNMAAACKELGLLYLKDAYGAGKRAIYMGYDNADGKALAKSEAFAKVLNAHGVACYTDAVSD